MRPIDLTPNTGRASLRVLAEQVKVAADALQSETGSAELDLVGFSMGALVSRYFLQRLGGRDRVRRFVSISGPQQGTATAYLLNHAGVQEMRPNSVLLKELDADPDPWGRTQVFSFWTPFDLMIVPPRSSALPGARERKFPVVLHPLMLWDRKVLDAVADALSAT